MATKLKAKAQIYACSSREQAKQELLHISQGKATLACPWGGVAGDPLSADPQAGGCEVGYSFPARQMTDETLRGFA